MKNESTTMAQDPQPDAISLRVGRSSTRDGFDNLGTSLVADRIYGHDGPSGRYWSGREQILEGSVFRGRVNATMVDLVNRYRYSSAYLAVVTFAAILSEVL